jgi:hypothetical protein
VQTIEFPDDQQTLSFRISLAKSKISVLNSALTLGKIEKTKLGNNNFTKTKNTQASSTTSAPEIITFWFVPSKTIFTLIKIIETNINIYDTE